MPHMTGDQSLLKRINRMALVRLVKAEPGLSRVDLAGRTGLTKTTVGMLVQELIDEGWLRQNAPAEGQRVGRRPLPLTLDPDRIGLLGAEIGVDYINVIGCNLLGELLHAKRVAYQHRDVTRTLRTLAAMVARSHAALADTGRRVLGLGVAVPGMIDARDGALRFAPQHRLARRSHRAAPQRPPGRGRAVRALAGGDQRRQRRGPLRVRVRRRAPERPAGLPDHRHRPGRRPGALGPALPGARRHRRRGGAHHPAARRPPLRLRAAGLRRDLRLAAGGEPRG